MSYDQVVVMSCQQHCMCKIEVASLNYLNVVAFMELNDTLQNQSFPMN